MVQGRTIGVTSNILLFDNLHFMVNWKGEGGKTINTPDTAPPATEEYRGSHKICWTVAPIQIVCDELQDGQGTWLSAQTTWRTVYVWIVLVMAKVKMNTIYRIIIPTLKHKTSKRLLAIPISSSACSEGVCDIPHRDDFHASNTSMSSSPSLFCHGQHNPCHDRRGSELRIHITLASDHRIQWREESSPSTGDGIVVVYVLSKGPVKPMLASYYTISWFFFFFSNSRDTEAVREAGVPGRRAGTKWAQGGPTEVTLQVTLALTQCDTPTTHNSSLALAWGELAAAGEKARGQQGRWEAAQYQEGAHCCWSYYTPHHSIQTPMQQWPTKLGADIMDLTMIVQDKYNASEAGSTGVRGAGCSMTLRSRWPPCSGLGNQKVTVSTKLLPTDQGHLGWATLAQQCMQ